MEQDLLWGIEHGMQSNDARMRDLMENIDFMMNLLFLVAEAGLVDHFDRYVLVGFQRMTTVDGAELATAKHFDGIDLVPFVDIAVV